MTSLFQRSPIRSPTRRVHRVERYGEDHTDRHEKKPWLYFPHVLGTGLVLLFVGSLFWGPVETVDSPINRLGASIANGQSFSAKPSLHLLGERHSGTKWMTEHLMECFGEDIQIRKGFSAWKHWFQKENNHVGNAVVVAQFRNPYYWVEAMNRFPHHSPEHFDLDWKTFVTKPWTMDRYGEDIQFDGATEATIDENIMCRTCDSLAPYEVIPCLANWTIIQELDSEEGRRITDAFYEMRHDGSGQPYDSILELRRDKIKNFLQVANFPNVKETYAVQYDEMVAEGTDLLISSLEKALGVKAKCSPHPGGKSSKRTLDTDFVEYLRDHIDWDAEALIGFTPRDF